MHSCPRCGMCCDCSGDIDDCEVMSASWVAKNCKCDCEESAPDPDYQDDDDEGEIIGYTCLSCGHDQDDPDECERCLSNALDPIYF